MRYRRERAEVICRELMRLMTVQSVDAEGIKFKDGLYWNPIEADAATAQYKDFDPKKDKWTGKDTNGWFTVNITVPESFNGKPLAFIVNTQANGWDATNPQFLAFLNGRAETGLDVNHRDVHVTNTAKAGDKYRLDLQGYTGSAHSELDLTIKMVEFNPAVRQLYYDIITPVRILGRLQKLRNDDRVMYALEAAIEKVLNVIDIRAGHTPEFFASVDKAIAVAHEEIYTKLAGHEDIIATSVGHTHIDVAWWWTVAQTRQKTVRSFATVLKYMEDYPDYIFMSSQPQLYKFIKEHNPEMFERIKERVKEGRWEAEGGMWVEADCNVTSGESLIRQFMHGKRFFKEEFGVENNILWLPDVFGYSAAMPQIMKLCGIDYFMTTKMSWNQWNRIPYDTFNWRGIDGSEVFTHMITTTGTQKPMEQFFTTYNGNLHPNDVMGAWDRYQQKELNNDVLISYGHGDGGGGPTREMVEQGLRLMSGIEGAPKVRMADSRTYFNEIHSKLNKNPKLPKWVGELYFEYHRGTYTSMARNKTANRKNELLLQELEFISVLADKMGYPQQEINDMWECLLLNQFHDILPGTSIKEVYEVTKQEYEAVAKQATSLLKDRLPQVAGKVGGDIAVVNTLGYHRDDVVIIDKAVAPGQDILVNAVGDGFPVQKTHDGKTIAYVYDVPAKGALGLAFESYAEEIENELVIDGLKIDTPFYNAEFDEKGFIAKLTHKESGREVLTGCEEACCGKGIKGNELRVYEDRPIDYDNWDIDIYHTEKSWLVDDTTKVEWLERGPVRATMLVERKFLDSVISQKIHFYADTARIDFETYVDWKQKQLLLKARFATDIQTPHATYDIQFGNVQRPTHCNTSWDEARFETCAHKWADLSEGGFGVSILNDCKYGHFIRDGVIALTLLKSGVVPNPDSDQEEHCFTYSLLPHMGDWRVGNTVYEAYNINTPLHAAEASKDADEGEFSFISVDHPNIMIETVKKAESGNSVIVRMYEFENTRSDAEITLCCTAKEVYETDALENRKAKLDGNVETFNITLKPFEIKTIEIVF
ncbi:MAG: alpha-mannosidase [Defluviitaleaceae bacterium]|nr:alpha-mannosidase [Defluviitaleaceae bacterium]